MTASVAQDVLPYDNGLATYHSGPRYRESESHPLRVLAYAVHPVGWIAREVFFRPLSYFASSTETRRSLLGYREPFDYRNPECFSADDSIPDCRALPPYYYDAGGLGGGLDSGDTLDTKMSGRQVYFPDVNFDFDKRKLNDLGFGKTHMVADMLRQSPGVHLVLQGHTDYLGSEAYNEKLGMDRAEAVRKALIDLGVSADQLSTVTFGKSQPLYEDKADWARAVNRRVEVHVDNAS